MEKFNDLVDRAIVVVRNEKRSSVSLIQNRLGCAYREAYEVQEKLVKLGIVSEANHVGRREVYGENPSE